MRVGVLGSGDVGKALAEGFLRDGDEVMIGTGHPEKLKEWLVKHKASVGNFAEVAEFGELVVLAVKGTEIEHVLNAAKHKSFDGKLLMDVTNPLLFVQGKAPQMTVGFPDSLGEKVQTLLPKAKVVKAFNIVTAKYMTNPKLKEGVPDMFIAGNDAAAKKRVAEIAKHWGWPVTDIGGIDQSYLLEALAMFWIRYGFVHNHWTHAWKLLKS